MNVLYIHQYFCTRAGRSGTRSYEFARFLVQQGHKVTMLTSDSDLSDVRVPEGRSQARFSVDGIDVVAVRAPYSQHLGAAGRIQSFLRFMVASSWAACRLPRHDVVVATSTPLTVGVPGMLVSARRRIPLVFEVRDLWPEAPIQMGAIRNPVLIAVLRAFERMVYRHSAHIIALSPGMKDGVVAAGVTPERVTMIPKCSDLDLFKPGVARDADLDRYDLRGKFVVGYAGSMGEANDVEVLLAAAGHLAGEPSIAFLLIGGGRQAAELQGRVARLGLPNVRFAGSMPRQEVAEVLHAADVCVVLFTAIPVLATNSPNKLFDALAAGKPVIVNSDGWTRKLVQEHGVGRYATPGSGEALANEIRWLAARRSELASMGRRARALAEKDFDRQKLAQVFSEVLVRAAGGSPGSIEQDAELVRHVGGSNPQAGDVDSTADALLRVVPQVPLHGGGPAREHDTGNAIDRSRRHVEDIEITTSGDRG